MSAHVLLNLLYEVGEKIRCEAFLSVLPNEFNKFNKLNTGARMQDSIYHRISLANFVPKRHDFAIRKRNVLWTSTHNVTM